MSELAAILEDTIERLFAERVTKEMLERAERGEVESALWEAMRTGGFTRPHLAEAAGGAGGSWLDAFVILRAAGRASLPLPLPETILGSWLLERAGIEPPPGAITVLPRLVEVGETAAGSLTASFSRVPYGRSADHVVFAVRTGGEPLIGLCEVSSAKITPGENLAREPRDDLAFDGAPILAKRPAKLVPDPVRVYGAFVRSAQAAGALESILSQSVRYARERIQFGKPIGSFQAIQQNLALLAGHAAAAAAAAEAAARKLAEDAGDPSFEIAVAKVRTIGAADAATGIAHQVHGAIGFTYEHGLHFSTRRLWSWRSEFGVEAEWAAMLGKLAVAAGRDGLWPLVTGR